MKFLLRRETEQDNLLPSALATNKGGIGLGEKIQALDAGLDWDQLQRAKSLTTLNRSLADGAITVETYYEMKAALGI